MRITGGIWRSRRLVAPKGQATRPTSDRVREALFSILTSEGVFGGEGPAVLDLYAGSGALAFEALSRGATRAVLVEHARDALTAIRANAKSLQADVRVVATKVESAVAGLGAETFDLILVDPPYIEVTRPRFVEPLAVAATTLRPGGILVLEHAAADGPPPIAGLDVERTRRYGDTALTLYVRAMANVVAIAKAVSNDGENDD